MSKAITVLTLTYLLRDGKVALARKRCGKGAGRYNGYGGHVEEGEQILEAAIREVCEETQGVLVDPLALKKAAELDFHFAGQETIMRVHVFTAAAWQGEPQESEEMESPQWFAPEEVIGLSDQMWAADAIWLPEVLLGKTMSGVFHYNIEGTRVGIYQLAEVLFNS